MIGNVIQAKFLESLDYPTAAALSFVLMAAILVGLVIYARIVGSERMRVIALVRRHALTVYAFLAIGYLMLPIAVVILFSFNDPAGRFNYVWQGFTLDNWLDWDAAPGLRGSLVVSLQIGALATLVATALGHSDRARDRAPRVPRPGQRRTCSSSCRCPRQRSSSARPC